MGSVATFLIVVIFGAYDNTVAYTADAIVIHSHNLSLKEQYRRTFYQGYEMEKHRKLLSGANSITEGIRLSKYVAEELASQLRIISLFRFGLNGLARLMGDVMGSKAYKRTETSIGDNGIEIRD